MPPPREELEEAVRDACLDELAALKPGNVHRHAAGVGALLADFATSAAVAATALCAGPPGVGARILRAVAATRAAVGHNTNLGIVLLAAPLVEAAVEMVAAAPHPTLPHCAGEGFSPPPAQWGEAGRGVRRDHPLRAALARTLAALTVEDAALAFRAIVLAAPAGLGAAAEHDVRSAPTVTLLEAMRAAAPRDRVARQYADGYADVFDLGRRRLAEALDRGVPAEWATTAAYLAFLASAPDSHIARKHGDAAARAVQDEAAAIDAAVAAAAGDPRTREEALRRFDARLRRDGLNPGTSADLTVASLLVHRLVGGKRRGLDFSPITSAH
ncbi:triphosphoribosyl-dephospho-CoA synthase [Azospirillum sp. ST 5-10]|uniref:triphosphoribosyl-dephospho-CoA synthase n=1 Tax=unclassified Azospirillum TaxID=2630922 RepID=UPI003F4A4608